jgi:hypothetical protein
MRKILLFLLVGLLSVGASANPVYMPEVSLESLTFNAEKQWKITLRIILSPDSIMISSSTGRSVYKNPSYDVWTITADSLQSNVNIDSGGDSVSIVSYFMSWQYSLDSLTETFVFGDYPGAMIPAPLEGQSIVRVLPEIFGTNYYCLCGSSGNESGTVIGRIFDKENNPVTKGSFNLSPYPVTVNCTDYPYQTNGFDVDEDGTYSAQLYAIRYCQEFIQICTHKSVGDCYIYVINGSVKMDSIQFTMYPDSTVKQDIHLLEDYSNIRSQEQNTTGVLEIFPNPAANGYFHYEIGIPVKSAKCYFILFDSGGHTVWTHPVSGNSGEIEIPSGLNGGLYFLQARMNEKSIASAPLVIKR